MNTHLAVTRAFGPHAKGAIVSDLTIIEAILASDHAGHVVPVQASCTTPKNATPEKEA